MLKNFYKKIIAWFFIFISIFSSASAWWKDYVNIRWWSGWWAWGGDAPEVACKGLPGCGTKNPEKFFVNAIDLFIQIVIVLAVFALIFSWIMYMVSAWDEEKAKNAKTWIIWSLIWVFLSSSAWWIVFLLNSIKF